MDPVVEAYLRCCQEQRVQPFMALVDGWNEGCLIVNVGAVPVRTLELFSRAMSRCGEMVESSVPRGRRWGSKHRVSGTEVTERSRSTNRCATDREKQGEVSRLSVLVVVCGGHKHDDNASMSTGGNGGREVPSILELSQRPRLEALIEGVGAVVSHLGESLTRVELQGFPLSELRSSRELIRALPRCPQLSCLTLQRCALSVEQCHRLTNLPGGCGRLRELTLVDCGLTDESSNDLQRLLCVARGRGGPSTWRRMLRGSAHVHSAAGLERLNLSENALGDATLRALLGSLSAESALRVLELRGNLFSPGGVRQGIVHRALMATQLKVVDVSRRSWGSPAEEDALRAALAESMTAKGHHWKLVASVPGQLRLVQRTSLASTNVGAPSAPAASQRSRSIKDPEQRQVTARPKPPPLPMPTASRQSSPPTAATTQSTPPPPPPLPERSPSVRSGPVAQVTLQPPLTPLHGRRSSALLPPADASGRPRRSFSHPDPVGFATPLSEARRHGWEGGAAMGVRPPEDAYGHAEAAAAAVPRWPTTAPAAVPMCWLPAWMPMHPATGAPPAAAPWPWPPTPPAAWGSAPWTTGAAAPPRVDANTQTDDPLPSSSIKSRTSSVEKEAVVAVPAAKAVDVDELLAMPDSLHDTLPPQEDEEEEGEAGEAVAASTLLSLIARIHSHDMEVSEKVEHFSTTTGASLRELQTQLRTEMEKLENQQASWHADAIEDQRAMICTMNEWMEMQLARRPEDTMLAQLMSLIESGMQRIQQQWPATAAVDSGVKSGKEVAAPATPQRWPSVGVLARSVLPSDESRSHKDFLIAANKRLASLGW